MRKRSYTDEQFITAVKASTSWNQVFQKLGRKIGGGQYVVFKALAKKLNLNTSHFTGMGWNVGNHSGQLKNPTPLEKILTKDSLYVNTHCLKKRLLKSNIKTAKCENCNNTEWMGKPIPIQLDHINGNRTDNRIENLRILCPNCHAQTETFAGKNRKTKFSSLEISLDLNNLNFQYEVTVNALPSLALINNALAYNKNWALFKDHPGLIGKLDDNNVFSCIKLHEGSNSTQMHFKCTSKEIFDEFIQDIRVFQTKKSSGSQT